MISQRLISSATTSRFSSITYTRSVINTIQTRSSSKMTEASISPLSGLYAPCHLQKMYYGPSTVSKNLISSLPTPKSKAFIITGSSLATKTALISRIESLLGSAHHAGTFSKIGQHAPVAQLDEATKAVQDDNSIDTIISVGGGSPIDSAKAISYRCHEKGGKFLFHIAIPTTLSAAECTFNAGYTEASGKKVGVADPECAPHVIIYDAEFGCKTPEKLWLSTGIRALDHAVELLYHPYATEVAKRMTLSAIGELFVNLKAYKESPKDEDIITKCQLAAFMSLYPIGTNVKGGLGLSHTLGYAMGSPYGIPHGITSCISLAGVVALKAEDDKAAEQLARALPYIGEKGSGDAKKDALVFSKAIEKLVSDMGLKSRLGEYDVGKDQAEVIAETATQKGPLYESVLGLVKSRF